MQALTRPDDRRCASHDAIHRAAEQFALGRPYGLLPPPKDAGGGGALPFGLRHAVVSTPTPMPDLSAYGFDHDQQIGTVREGNQVVPLLRHTTGQTRTSTNPDGHRGPDSDTDRRED
jgi:putative ATP-grasp target RiPP